jgi:hypothetical protein
LPSDGPDKFIDCMHEADVLFDWVGALVQRDDGGGVALARAAARIVQFRKADLRRPAPAILRAMAFATPLALSACAGSVTPKVSGSEIGGAVPLAGITSEQASQLARAHCSKYGRTARPLATRSEAGGELVFECI